MEYYVQIIADNYIKNLITKPTGFHVHQKYAGDMDQEEFFRGYLELYDFMHRLYSSIRENPEEFPLPLHEIKEKNPVTVEYTRSNAAFIKIPDLILAAAISGTLENQTLCMEGSKFMAASKQFKITNLPRLMKKMEDYGFVTEGLSNKISPDDQLLLTYPDCPVLIPVLKALADAQDELMKQKRSYTEQEFQRLDYRILEREIPQKPKMKLEDFLNVLLPEQKDIVLDLHKMAVRCADYKVNLKMIMRNVWNVVYTHRASKRVLLSISNTQDELSVKMNLQQIGTYIDITGDFPENIRETIRNNGWECGACNSRCKGGYPFEMDGIHYNKCSGGAFTFSLSEPASMSYLFQLLEAEMACQSNTNLCGE